MLLWNISVTGYPYSDVLVFIGFFFCHGTDYDLISSPRRHTAVTSPSKFALLGKKGKTFTKH